jgi:hypothetical protein
MNGNAKILFFCMIFVGNSAFGQKNSIAIPRYHGTFSVANQPDTPHFCTMSLVKLGDKYFIGFPKKKSTIPPQPCISPVFPVIASNFYTQNFGFFCKKELQLEKLTKVPFKFRLGSVQQCDWMEGKPNAVQSF